VIHNKRNRRNRQSSQNAAISVIAEMVEPRMLLSAAPVLPPASTSGFNAAVAMKNVEIVAELRGHVPRIDEIRLVGSEIQVYSTYDGFRGWPNEIYLKAGDSNRLWSSEPVAVTVPADDLTVVHYIADRYQPRMELFNLRMFGTSTLLYRRADADSNTGWITHDIDPGAGSDTGLDFTAPPPAPEGLVATSISENSTDVTLYFDESPTTQFIGQRFVRQYEIVIHTAAGAIEDQIVAFDDTRFSTTDTDGLTQTFGGSKAFRLESNAYVWSVRVRAMPVFPDGGSGSNALASPWSPWSHDAHFSILPAGQQILLRNVGADSKTGIGSIEWGAVKNAAAYEVWINRVSDGSLILHETGLKTYSLQTEPLDPDNYRVWVRATRTDGTRTSWSKFLEMQVDLPSISIFTQVVSVDPTPTINWTNDPRITSYTITLIDLSRRYNSLPSEFSSDAEYRAYLTAYTRTVNSIESSHTVETPLALTNQGFDIEITFHYANGASVQATNRLYTEPIGVPIRLIPLGRDPFWMIPEGNILDGFRWNVAEGVASYDVWVNYLGFNTETDKHPAVWKFSFEEEVTSGLYHLPSDAPGGIYRIWLRPNTVSAGVVTKGAWSVPTNISFLSPVNRPMNIIQQGETLTWDTVPGATGYLVHIQSENVTSYTNVLYQSSISQYFTISDTSFVIPEDIPDGRFRIDVSALGGYGWNNPPTNEVFFVQHGTAPLPWTIRHTNNAIEWNAVPDAISYDVQITDHDTGNIVVDVSDIDATSLAIPTDLESGHYRVKLRALRSVNERQFLTEWATKDFVFGIVAPSNIQLNGTMLSWDGLADATYSVTVSMKNGRLNAPYRQGIWPSDVITFQSYPIGFGDYQFPSTTITTSATTLDLQSYIGALYSYDPTAALVVSVQTKVQNPDGEIGDNLTATSDPVEFTLPQKALWTNPIIETTPRSKPTAWSPIAGGENTIYIPTFSSLPSDVTSKHIYRNGNGEAIDLEYVERFQLRVTDLQTGVVRNFDDSQVPELLQMRDEYELPVLNLYPIAVYDIAFTGATIPLATQLGLSNSVYKIESRIQYLPVILSATTSDPYKFLLTDTQPDHINVAATPWSDWSTPLEYTILPDGQNILPIGNTKGTIDPRPTFAWGSNTPNAQYELWVENRATKQRVLHETLTDVHQFQSTTNLPPGQYDWWVRIVGTEGARKGWSAKQSLEIFAPAISSTVVAETADATPVVSWTAVTGAQSYAVTLTSTATGKVVYTANAAANTTSHRVATTLPNDTYTVSIQALLSNGARTAPGVADSGGGFVLKRMVVGAAPKNVVFASSRVSWQTATDATKYNVWINYISPTGKTERIFRQNAFGTDISLPTSLTSRAGEYRVWIRAIRSEAGQDYVGRWSDVKTLTVGASPASLNASALTLVMSDLATTGLQL
jgi:hypothetical protein